MVLEVFERLHVKIDPKEKAADLTTGFQQIVEIAKVISQDACVLFVLKMWVSMK